MNATFVGTEWRLTSLGTEPVETRGDQASVTLKFMSIAGEGEGNGSNLDVGGRAGCNRYHGRCQVHGDTLAVGPLATTRMLCPPSQMALEMRYLEMLAAATRLTREDGALVIESKSGLLHFVAESGGDAR